MLVSMPIALPMQLMGPLGATASDIQNLQRALANLATATQRPQINPGPVTGTVNDATMTAVAAAMGLLTDQLPSWAYLSLQAGLALGAGTQQAKDVVASQATALTVAANTAAVKYKVNTPMPMGFNPAGFFAPGWYKTPQGMIFIGVVAFVVWKFFLQPKQAA